MAQKSKLLVIEDEPEVREIIVASLEVLPFEITGAADGQKGLQETLAQPFSAILCDINMPNLSGLEFLRKLREQGSQVPVVFLTAYSDKERILEALRLGAFDYIEKPFQIEKLREVCQRASEVGNKHLEAEKFRRSLQKIHSSAR